MKKIILLALLALSAQQSLAQSRGLVNTSDSRFASVYGVDMGAAQWDGGGFWGERFAVCRDAMVPALGRTLCNPNVAHAFRNFEIAAGLCSGEHLGPPFHDGDFYKWFEGLAAVYAATKNPAIDRQMDSIIAVISAAQRPDGYIHTPVIIEQRSKGTDSKFADRLNFETYNLGHLITAGVVHHRATGKSSLLNVAKKAADYLCAFYANASAELARNAICPSHYMAVVELYRTTREPKYLELAKNLIDIRGMMQNGTDDNQDRVPFRAQRKAMGHAVRANYLYAGVADVVAETGDTTLLAPLHSIWRDMTSRKMYITGACGALYDGTSPDGTCYTPDSIQKVHQAYGRDYQLPNATAHNESCANIGNLLWNWRMFLLTAQAQYVDVVEQALYNSILAGVSLDGLRFFYTNPLSVSFRTPYTLRWSKEREPYISFCNCCPPNTARTLAEVQSYAYSLSQRGLWVNLYGAGTLETSLADGRKIKLTQQTDYPWQGDILLHVADVGQAKKGEQDFSIYLRIPSWASNATISVGGAEAQAVKGGQYVELRHAWKKGDMLALHLPMKAALVEANPLVEEARNQVAVRRGPIVYCLESPDLPDGRNVFDITIPANIELVAKPFSIASSRMICLEGEAQIADNSSWNNTLYRELQPSNSKASIRLVPYYAWGNRGRSEMTVWMPIAR
jgi:DUF1680 family protein